MKGCCWKKATSGGPYIGTVGGLYMQPTMQVAGSAGDLRLALPALCVHPRTKLEKGSFMRRESTRILDSSTWTD